MQNSISLFLKETCGLKRINEPVTAGIPFPEKLLYDTSGINLFENENIIPLQTKVLDRCFDGSIKWLLLDFQASAEPNSIRNYLLKITPSSLISSSPSPAETMISKDGDFYIINTGKATFRLNNKVFNPFESVIINGKEILDISKSKITLLDNRNIEYFPVIKNIQVKTNGPIRSTIKIEGWFFSEKRIFFCNFLSRISFFKDHSFVKIDFTLHNPRAAKHPGGLWDLGDKGSIFFNDLSFFTSLKTSKKTHIKWISRPDRKFELPLENKITIYQDSSGGDNWMSANHVNRFDKVMNTFRGYKVYSDPKKIIGEGLRANPIINISNESGSVSGYMKRFWQNFPKAIEARENTLVIRLFPEQYNDVFELQGGEQKTHTFFLSFAPDTDSTTDLRWIDNPLILKTSPEWYSKSKVFSHLTPHNQDKNSEYTVLADSVIKGNNTFFHKREIIDEYGWRHFGDVYADHEAIKCEKESPLASHYNNQYDVINGLLFQFVRSGNEKWRELAEDMARHVIDIDIYHTNKDKAAYNGGMFWHTDHYVDAATSTHRTYSKETLKTKNLKRYGGGPSNQHNYTTGLLYHYFLTGETASRDAVLGLADWVINMDDGRKTIFRFLSKSPTGLASATSFGDYHGPGRGAGNSINALIDAHILSKDQKYLKKAEEIIRRCVHPEMDISSQNLDNVEYKWSYLVFLQVLGKYLDYKNELHQKDYNYYYGRESLIHYGKWMLENEVPFSKVKEKVRIWTETWPAQDIRKSYVFDYAAKYSNEPLRTKFLEKSNFFYKSSISELMTYETKYFTRPTAIMIVNSTMHDHFLKTLDNNYNPESCPYMLKAFKTFVSQKEIVKKRIKIIIFIILLFSIVLLSKLI